MTKRRFKFPFLVILGLVAKDIPAFVNEAVEAHNNDSRTTSVQAGKFRVWSVALDITGNLGPLVRQVVNAKADGVVDDEETAEIAAAAAAAIVGPLAKELARNDKQNAITDEEWAVIASDAARRLAPKIKTALEEANKS